MTVSPVLVSLVFGTLLAMLLDRKFFGQGFVRTLLITPFLLMPVVAGLIWKNQMFSSASGSSTGCSNASASTRSSSCRATRVLDRVVLVWQWTPFMMLIMLAGLQSQPSDVLEAAKVDGASAFGIFRQLTLSHLRPYMELGALLGTIYLIQVFDHIDVMTGGRSGLDEPALLRLPAVDRRWLGCSARPRPTPSSSSSPRSSSPTFALRVLSSLLKGEEADRMSARAADRLGVGERRWGSSGCSGSLAWSPRSCSSSPVFWMVLNSFKTEQDANTSPKLLFDPTLDRYRDVTESTGAALVPRGAIELGMVVVTVSTLIVLALAIPAAYALAIKPIRSGATCCSSSSRRSSCPSSRRSCRSGSSPGSSTCSTPDSC